MASTSTTFLLRSERARVPAAARSILLLVLAAALAVAAFRLVHWALIYQISFDGAMNLELARSLVEGTGYKRLYEASSAVEHAVQTRAPFILPGAAVFAAFGVGPWQSQAVNLLYLVAFALALFLLVRRWCSWPWALAAATVCLCAPEIQTIALNGYGEVPALVWWLFALLVLYRPDDERPLAPSRCIAAGVLLGIGVLTKTVLAIGVIAVAPILVYEQIRRARRLGPAFAAMAALALGIVLPLLLHEAWHAWNLGGMRPWMNWLQAELQAVHMQAGTHSGFVDTAGFLAKVATHFGVLATALRLPPWAVALLLAALAALALGARRWLPSAPARALVWTIALFAIVYFTWWLALSPTQKAWYRRIFNGMVALELLAVLCAGLLASQRRRAPGTARRSAGIAATIALGVIVPLCVIGLTIHPKLVSPHDSALAQDFDALRRLPADARYYGVGWHSAPAIALYAGLRLADINTRTRAELAAQSPAYLLLDPSARAAQIDRIWRQRYESEQIADTDDLRIVELFTDRERNPFADVNVDKDLAQSRVDLGGADYPYRFGIYDREGDGNDGWRWIGPDAEILLRYGGEQEFALDAYTQPANAYRARATPDVTLRLNDCVLGVLHLQPSARAEQRLRVDACALQPGQLVRVKLVSSTLLDSADDRQLAFISHSLGFVPAAANAAPANAASEDSTQH